MAMLKNALTPLCIGQNKIDLSIFWVFRNQQPDPDRGFDRLCASGGGIGYARYNELSARVSTSKSLFRQQ